jgi:septal ring factor EnvC (AmiA/AmiB activator)
LLFLAFNAWSSGESTLSQEDAAARLEQLKTEINGLSRELEHARETLSEEQQALRAVDMEIQRNTLELRTLESRRHNHLAELSDLRDDRRTYLTSLDERSDALASQVMAAYRLGRESRLKLLLNQDSPAQLSRTLAYYDFISRSHASQITELKDVLRTLDGMQVEINRKLSDLQTVQLSQQAVQDDLLKKRGERQSIIDDLASRISNDEARLTEMQRNRRDLETLLARLSNVLADIPADLGKKRRMDELKGEMMLPVNGPVRFAFGQRRTAGLRWHGWLIGAPAGSAVKAVAHGRVAFSDWLRGYGLLLIIDHGDGYMSLYGNNESLLHEVGDWVDPGTTVSTVGSSPLNGDGLYFELRANGKAMDPAVWINR